MQVPVVGRDAAFLPVMPARIFLNGIPEFFRRKRDALRESFNGAGEVQLHQDAADIENCRAEPSVGHELVSGGIGRSCRRWRFTAFQDANDSGKNRYNGDDGNDVVDVLTDVGYRAAETVAAKNHGAHPENSAENIEHHVAAVGHAGCASNRWAECSNNGNEARENNRAATVLFVKIVRALQMTTAEEERVLAFVQRRSCGTANPVADLVANDGAEHYGQEQPAEGKKAASSKNSRRDEQGVARKKEADKKTGFDKHDAADERRAAGANEFS